MFKRWIILDFGYIFWCSILITLFSGTFGCSLQNQHSLEICFAYKNMLYFLILMFSFWGLKLSLSWRKMSLLFANVVLKPMFSPRVFATFLHFAFTATFSTKIVFSFFLTYKLLKLYVCEVASICRAFWASQERILSKSVVSEAGISYNYL